MVVHAITAICTGYGSNTAVISRHTDEVLNGQLTFIAHDERVTASAKPDLPSALPEGDTPAV
jgi:hypothetical protein